jgi:hypothetical protein
MRGFITLTITLNDIRARGCQSLRLGRVGGACQRPHAPTRSK